MKNYLLATLGCLLLLTCGPSSTTTDSAEELPVAEPMADLTIARIDTFSFPSSIRALQAVDENTVWFAGSSGRVGHTSDGGETWQVDSIEHEGRLLHFRSIAVTDQAVFVLSIESPALLYRSIDQGQSWELVYQEDHPAAFYDAMQFWDNQTGIAMGDPTDGCISIIMTEDGGQSWQKIPCDRLPAAAEGEAAFAASNSNIALQGDQAWIVTGGAKARVLHSSDRAKSWSIYQSPLAEGGQMTGIYTVDFWDEQQGIIFGGDWNDKAINTSNKASTKDGGQSWQLLADGAGPGYRSSVKYFPQGAGQAILAAGIPGISVSYDSGENWEELSTESWYALSFVPDSKECWLSGGGKLGRIVWE